MHALTATLRRRAAALGLAALASTAPLPAAGPSADSRDLGRGRPFSAWREAGLTPQEAAAHLLDRAGFGPRPGEVESVAAQGVDRWLAVQLAAGLPETGLAARLARYDALSMPAETIYRTYPAPGRVLVEAQRAGAVPRDTDPAALVEGASAEAAEARRALAGFARERGYRRQRELVGQLTDQRVVRGVYAANALAERLTVFWSNHFSVSIADPEARAAVLPYERDAIRPRVLGPFRELLGATARDPAMLLYLDNARSIAAEGAPTTAGRALDRRSGRIGSRRPGRLGGGAGSGDPMVRRRRELPPDDPRRTRMPTGLNENYARELLELHTLGVDGGYTQSDVVEAARAFTGWTVLPPGRADEVRGRLARRAGGLGFVADGSFLFRADAHDAGAKTILGAAFPAGGGIEEGERVLDLLAAHPSTARFVSTKLAAHFVADEPPPALVERMAERWRATGGELTAVLATLFESPEFWAPAARRAKVKSPFELAVSALRAVDADLVEPRPTVDWIERMGQPLYAAPSPAGWPDRAGAWLDAGALSQRANFVLELAEGRLAGAHFDPSAAAASLGAPEFQRR